METIVIIAGIDGFSRCCVFVRCSDNNHAVTAFQKFREEGVASYGVPSRVRTDHGGENIEIGTYIIEQRGITGFITGKSSHNQRIERFWRDLTRSDTNFYKILFSFMEKENIYLFHHLFL